MLRFDTRDASDVDVGPEAATVDGGGGDIAYRRSLKWFLSRPALESFACSLGLFTALIYFLPPSWPVMDDVSNAMAAHGFGIAEYASPVVVSTSLLGLNSTPAFGFLLQFVPTIGGVLGYTIAIYSLTFTAIWAIGFFLLRMGARRDVTALATALVASLAVVYPTFTVTAGLLGVGSVMGFRAFAKAGGWGSLFVACALALASFGVRDQAFLMIILVALPFLPWRALWRQRSLKIAVLATGLGMAAIMAVGISARSGPEWQEFNNFLSVYYQLITENADSYLIAHPEILSQYGYTENDINLLSDWFFVDPQIADPAKLQPMLAGLPPLYAQDGSVSEALSNLKTLFQEPLLLFISIPAVVLMALYRRWQVLLMWVLAELSFFLLALTARPHLPMRVFIPIACLLLLAPIALDRRARRLADDGAGAVVTPSSFSPATQTTGEPDAPPTGRWFTAAVVATLSVGLAWGVWELARLTKVEQIRQEGAAVSLRAMPVDAPLVVWGDSFSFEIAYPPFADPQLRQLRIESLAGMALAPWSVSQSLETSGNGMLARLRTAQGIRIIAKPHQLKMLSTYCLERKLGPLRYLAAEEYYGEPVRWVSCSPVDVSVPRGSSGAETTPAARSSAGRTSRAPR